LTDQYDQPMPLGPDHRLGAFERRSGEQTVWLRRHARQTPAVGTTRVFVVTTTAISDVVAHYAWTMAGLDITDAPSGSRKGAGWYSRPVAVSGVHQAVCQGV